MNYIKRIVIALEAIANALQNKDDKKPVSIESAPVTVTSSKTYSRRPKKVQLYSVISGDFAGEYKSVRAAHNALGLKGGGKSYDGMICRGHRFKFVY